MNELQQETRVKLEAVISGDLSSIKIIQCGLCEHLRPLYSKKRHMTMWLLKHFQTWEHFLRKEVFPNCVRYI